MPLALSRDRRYRRASAIPKQGWGKQAGAIPVRLLPAFLTVASAIAFTPLATLIFVFAGTPQPIAIRPATTALVAVTSTVAHALFAANVLILAGPTQTITAIGLDLLYRVLMFSRPWNIETDGSRNA